MKLRAKTFPKYFEQLKNGTKEVDYRQFETITFENTETGEEIEFEIEHIGQIGVCERENCERDHPDVVWDNDRHIFGIVLGKRKKEVMRNGEI